MKKVLITGGSGLIGSHLARKLGKKGYEVGLLSRKPPSDGPHPAFFWDPEKGKMDPRALDQVDFIIHLAGLNIGGGRWTPRRKKQIVDSRVKSGDLVLQSIQAQKIKPLAFISASGIGYYGAVTTKDVFEEHAPAARDFLGRTCQQWEAVADRFEEYGIRSVKLRAGVVLSKEGGALPRLSLPVRLGAGAPLGSGKQYMPWIHMEDLCEMFVYAMEHKELTGAYNAVAPQHRTNREFTREIARELKRPLWLPRIPSFIFKLFFGEMSAILLEGSRVSSEKIRDAGYKFQYPDLGPALKNLLG